MRARTSRGAVVADASTDAVGSSGSGDSSPSGTGDDGKAASEWEGDAAKAADGGADAGGESSSLAGLLSVAADAAQNDEAADDEEVEEKPGRHTQRKQDRGHIAPSHNIAQEDVTVVWNLSNEPRLKFTMPCVADRGFNESQWTSARLAREVLFLESDAERWELSLEGSEVATSGSAAALGSARFRWARVKAPRELDSVMLNALSPLPLPAHLLEVVEAAVSWEEFEWAESSVWLRGKEYALRCLEWRTASIEVEATR